MKHFKTVFKTVNKEMAKVLTKTEMRQCAVLLKEYAGILENNKEKSKLTDCNKLRERLCDVLNSQGISIANLI